MPVERPHLIFSGYGDERLFEAKGGGGKSPKPSPVTNRLANAARIVREFNEAVDSLAPSANSLVDPDALPITIRASTEWGVAHSIPGGKNKALSVLGHKSKARLNVSFNPASLESVEAASLKYVDHDGDEARRKPQYFNFFESRPSVAVTTVEDVWGANVALPAAGKEIAWEVWLFSHGEARFRQSIEKLKIPNPRRGVQFGDITVLAMAGTRETLETVVRSASITQLRPASSLNTSLLSMPPGAQQQAVISAASRISPALPRAPAVCLLDTGLYVAHPLLAASVRFSGAVGGIPNGDDQDGHGTQMAGVALFEDVSRFLLTGATRHAYALESVKIKAPVGAPAAMSLPAELVRDAVSLVERSQGGQRTYCLAMNAPTEADDGSPSSFSSELDSLAFEVANRRLFCVAAGNLDGPAIKGDYQTLNEITGVMSPGQAWNGLTVGASTQLAAVPSTHSPVAPTGDLSPWSRTTVNWDRDNRPPTKPDVVYEGGNQMMDLASDTIGPHVDLCILTTGANPHEPLVLTGQTSPATAAVAGLCAGIQAEYPDFWPETVRGLVVHSSEYSSAMRARVATLDSPKEALQARFGNGQPDRRRAFENASNALTLIVQDTLRPYRLNDTGKGIILGKMTFHELPWPKEILETLHGEQAELRVTLSYFIEPNPGAVLRGNHDAYASHGLEFDVRRPDESDEQAIFRVNALGRPNRPSTSPATDWQFGKARARGSVKHDRWKGPATDLARMGAVMIFPRKGWWPEHSDKWQQIVRYSLVVSIQTRAAEVYSAVATKIATMV